MYKALIKPLFFLFDPEKVHHFVFNNIKFWFSIPFIKTITGLFYKTKHKSLEREVFGIKFPNPVGLAAGFDKDAKLYKELSAFGFGYIEIGSLTPKSQIGNPKPRLFRIPEDEGLINRMGFNNFGVDAAVERLKNKPANLIVGGNIGKNTATPNEDAKEDYIYNFKALHNYIDYFVVNVSCPNVKNLTKLQDTDFLIDLLKELKSIDAKQATSKPILLKIAPDLNDTQLDEVIEIVAGSKIDGIIAANTSTSRDNLKTSEERLQEISNGGLSGKPANKRSTEVIKYLHDKSNGAFPIIGVGGIHSAEDAIEKLKAGASLVQVYTGFIYEGPALVKRINKEIIKQGL
jgi:dihydroorotate dehydrogenase